MERGAGFAQVVESDAEGEESAALLGRQTKQAAEMAAAAICECSVPQHVRDLGDVDEVAEEGVESADLVGLSPQQMV